MTTTRKPTALSGALTAAAAICTVAAFSGGLLYLDQLIERPFTVTTASANSAANTFPADSEIRKILAERVDLRAESIGIVVGTIGPHGRSVVAHGKFGAKDPRPVDADTLFEIGSITKVFTSLLLADMAATGEVKLDAPLATYMPEGATVPERAGKSITLVDLATHRSSLPSLPDDLVPPDTLNPYATYTTEQLYRFLSRYQLPRDIGADFEYSNTGFGLLGHALARRAGVDYEALVSQRITTPLGMSSTAITLSPELAGRMATGHNSDLQPVPNWDLPAFAGAGALRSSTNDLLDFLAMALGTEKSPLNAAVTAASVKRKPVNYDTQVGLAWMVTESSSGDIVWHSGGTGGFTTFIGFHPASRTGVVVLSNSDAGVNDIGMHLLNRDIPLTEPKPKPVEAVVDPKLFDGYAGSYQLAPNLVFEISRDGDKLFAQLTGQPRLRLFPEGSHRFFYKDVEAAITFVPNGTGPSPSLTLHQFGNDVSAQRVTD
ncbi:CubicO group peptidase (beta-lactamase class C family) [Aminobacter lissarensis]|uniref:CubicO group peptidase (Beta-lactamase class C family) n=1 Tax=Aminobacter carboxidus TaxID=376165 RepID=A0A8E2BFX9_9HYPH|nr:serine hydrolase [Aminobacter lissarensis]MBB6469312.1 CubicO group peptidase (beta-lactamase class C family) [Aminobacter lissarensis]